MSRRQPLSRSRRLTRSTSQRRETSLQVEGLEQRQLLAGDGLEAIDASSIVDAIDLTRGAVIQGRKWEDWNGNGRPNAAEPGLAGVTIYADYNENGRLDRNEPRALTSRDNPDTDFDESGYYTLRGVRPGEHLIREVVPDGFVQTFPPTAVPLPATVQERDPFATVSPGHLIMRPAVGETVTRRVSVSVLPFCVRPIEINVVASDPDIQFQNVTGTQVNGCGGSTSTFAVQFTGDGDAHRFNLQFVDTLNNETIASLPVLMLAPHSGGAHRVSVAAGDRITDIDFGNQRIDGSGALHGRKWEDLNGNGQHDDGEAGLPGVTIYLDSNFNGQLDPHEISTHTMLDNPQTAVDESGRYSFDRLPPGRYVVREVVPDGYVQTFPPELVVDPLPGEELPNVPQGRFHGVTLEPGDEIRGLDFGNQPDVPGGIAGIKWRDANGNGQRDANEPGLAGVTIYIDLNRNGRLNAGEPRTESAEDDPLTRVDETGWYRFDAVPAGRYLVREVVPDGFVQTFPLRLVNDEQLSIAPETIGGAHVVQVLPGEVTGNIDFGNQRVRPAAVSGRKWLDDNRDGRQNDNEPGLPGVTIYADLNFNSRLDDNEPRTITRRDDPVTDFDEAGLYVLGDLPVGLVSIREVVPDGFVQTFPPQNIDVIPVVDEADEALDAVRYGSGGHFVYLRPGSSVDGLDFGNDRIEPGTIRGLKWNDLNRNGQLDPTEPGMSDVTIYLDLNRNGQLDEDEPTTQTLTDDPATAVDETGRYGFANLDPGAYVVREVVPEGFAQSFPGETVIVGQSSENLPPGSALAMELVNVQSTPNNNGTYNLDLTYEVVWPNSCGHVVNPLTQVNVVRDQIDVSLRGVELQGVCLPVVTSERVTVTAENLRRRGYGVTAVLQEPGRGELQFVDSIVNEAKVSVQREGSHTVRVGPGQVVRGVNFGNHRVPVGDFNHDGTVDALDIDLVGAAIREFSTDLVFDLSGDNQVDLRDLVVMVKEVVETDFGNANLDDQFDSGDLVDVFKAGEYEDGIEDNSGWAEGDWNGDGDFDSSDLVFAFADGQYVR